VKNAFRLVVERGDFALKVNSDHAAGETVPQNILESFSLIARFRTSKVLSWHDLKIPELFTYQCLNRKYFNNNPHP
jgi:hypothetical protein